MRTHVTDRVASLLLEAMPRFVGVALAAVLVVVGCAGSPSAFDPGKPHDPGRPQAPAAATRSPELLPAGWRAVVTSRGRPSVATRTVDVDGATVTLVRLDAPSTRLVLHPGYLDPGGTGWSTHSAVQPAERPNLVAAFNGGFKLNLGVGGMAVGDRQAGQLLPGLASVVTYTDSTSDIGSWKRDVPAAGRRIASVRQNLHLLIDHGHAAANIDSERAWGATLGGVFPIARSALGIDSHHNLIWAGSPRTTPRALGEALVAAGAQQALELDINPYWVCAFAFPLAGQMALMPGQQRPNGTYLTPWKRDFFTVDSR